MFCGSNKSDLYAPEVFNPDKTKLTLTWFQLTGRDMFSRWTVRNQHSDERRLTKQFTRAEISHLRFLFFECDWGSHFQFCLIYLWIRGEVLPLKKLGPFFGAASQESSSGVYSNSSASESRLTLHPPNLTKAVVSCSSSWLRLTSTVPSDQCSFTLLSFK